MTDLATFAALPGPHRAQLAQDTLSDLGITVHRTQGRELIHACPVAAYHSDQDRNPTAALNADSLLWHCLGCGAGGTLLWLIATLRGTTVEQARHWLSEKAGLGQAMATSDLLALFDGLYTPTRPAPLPRYSHRMLERLGPAPSYITQDRGIPAETAERMKVSYDPHGYIAREATGPRAVIPHVWDGTLVGWQSRRLPTADPSRSPKYHSTPDFPRDRTVYNHDPSRTEAVIVESPMSALRHMHHQPVEATFGAAVTDLQIRQLTRARRRVIWWPDNDQGGWRCAEGRTRDGRRYPGAPERASRYCENLIVESPFAADPAELDDETVDLLVAAAVPWPVWRRPERLFCHRCLREAHPSSCLGT